MTKDVVTRADVEKMAALSRIPLTKKDAEQIQRDLAGILGHFAQIQGVATGEVATSDDVTGLKNVARPDQEKTAELCLAETLLSAAPGRHNKYFQVKAVF